MTNYLKLLYLIKQQESTMSIYYAIKHDKRFHQIQKEHLWMHERTIKVKNTSGHEFSREFFAAFLDHFSIPQPSYIKKLKVVHYNGFFCVGLKKAISLKYLLKFIKWCETNDVGMFIDEIYTWDYEDQLKELGYKHKGFSIIQKGA